jgi:multiple sugar transport system permease protein
LFPAISAFSNKAAVVNRSNRYTPYLFLAPALAIIVAFRFIPATAGVWESFFSVSFLSDSTKVFVGLDNFLRLFGDEVFLRSIGNTLWFNLFVNPIQIAIALALAVLANRPLRGIAAFRSLMLLPVAVSLTISSLLGGMIVNQSGLLNGILVALGFSPLPFLLSPQTAMSTILGISSWIGCPFWMLFILAGMQNISPQIYESAAIDGAGPVTQFFKITLPLLKRTLVFVLVTDTVANFLLFIPVYVLTSGGPEKSTSTIMFEAYRRGLVYGDIGASSAMVSMLLVFLLLVIAAEFKLTNSEE